MKLAMNWWQRMLFAFGTAVLISLFSTSWDLPRSIGQGAVFCLVGLVPIHSMLRLGILVGAVSGLTSPITGEPYWQIMIFQVLSGIGAAVLISLAAEGVLAVVRWGYQHTRGSK